MLKPRAILPAGVFAGLLFTATYAAASTISYAPDGGQEGLWGPGPSGQSFGVLFTAPEPFLLDYSLTVSGSNFPFVSEIYQVTPSTSVFQLPGSTTVGPALFTSGILNTTPALATYTFNPNITLVAGEENRVSRPVLARST